MNNHASILEWLTAIGTVAAVVVAITIAALPAIRKWLHRPRLHVVVGDVEPHMRVALDSNSNKDGVWILAEVQNDGLLKPRTYGPWFRKCGRRLHLAHGSSVTLCRCRCTG